MNNPKIDSAIREMLNAELRRHGKTIEDVMGSQTWYSDYTMTTQQHAEWKLFCINLMRTRLKFAKCRAEKEFAWMDLMYGLKIQD